MKLGTTINWRAPQDVGAEAAEEYGLIVYAQKFSWFHERIVSSSNAKFSSRTDQESEKGRTLKPR
jgi:hypothetical protein